MPELYPAATIPPPDRDATLATTETKIHRRAISSVSITGERHSFIRRCPLLDADIIRVARLVQVKERLYRWNYEILAQITPEERKQKLAETYKNVEDDYKRILSSLRPHEEGELWEWIDGDGDGSDGGDDDDEEEE